MPGLSCWVLKVVSLRPAQPDSFPGVAGITPATEQVEDFTVLCLSSDQGGTPLKKILLRCVQAQSIDLFGFSRKSKSTGRGLIVCFVAMIFVWDQKTFEKEINYGGTR